MPVVIDVPSSNPEVPESLVQSFVPSLLNLLIKASLEPLINSKSASTSGNNIGKFIYIFFLDYFIKMTGLVLIDFSGHG